MHYPQSKLSSPHRGKWGLLDSWMGAADAGEQSAALRVNTCRASSAELQDSLGCNYDLPRFVVNDNFSLF